MAEEEKKESGGNEQENPGVVKAGSGKLKGLLLLVVGLVVYTGILFALTMLMGWGPSGSASASGGGSGNATTTPPIDIENFQAPAIIELSEITVYPKANKGRGPNRITCKLKLVISRDLADQIAPEGESENAKLDLLKLYARDYLGQLLEEYGGSLSEPASRERFKREAKLRLNLLKVEGDPEMQKYLQVLRGHVLQVVFHDIEQSNY